MPISFVSAESTSGFSITEDAMGDSHQRDQQRMFTRRKAINQAPEVLEQILKEVEAGNIMQAESLVVGLLPSSDKGKREISYVGGDATVIVVNNDKQRFVAKRLINGIVADGKDLSFDDI